MRLIERIAAGDAEALGELYDRYGRFAFGALSRMVAGPEAAEEVTQDAFHSVWRQAGSYRAERGSVRTWLLAICRNAAMDWRRTKGKRLERETMIDAAFDLTAEGRVDERVLSRLRAERVREAIAGLPAAQRDVPGLAFWGGASQREIPDRSGTARCSVKCPSPLTVRDISLRLAL